MKTGRRETVWVSALPTVKFYFAEVVVNLASKTGKQRVPCHAPDKVAHKDMRRRKYKRK
jgi:hypothetical protein